MLCIDPLDVEVSLHESSLSLLLHNNDNWPQRSVNRRTFLSSRISFSPGTIMHEIPDDCHASHGGINLRFWTCVLRVAPIDGTSSLLVVDGISCRELHCQLGNIYPLQPWLVLPYSELPAVSCPVCIGTCLLSPCRWLARWLALGRCVVLDCRDWVPPDSGFPRYPHASIHVHLTRIGQLSPALLACFLHLFAFLHPSLAFLHADHPGVFVHV